MRRMSAELRQQFERDGFVCLESLVSPETVASLNQALEQVLRGQFSSGRRPDKMPKPMKDARYTDTLLRRTSHL